MAKNITRSSRRSQRDALDFECKYDGAADTP